MNIMHDRGQNVSICDLSKNKGNQSICDFACSKQFFLKKYTHKFHSTNYTFFFQFLVAISFGNIKRIVTVFNNTCHVDWSM
jgi:hypothetical protein